MDKRSNIFHEGDTEPKETKQTAGVTPVTTAGVTPVTTASEVVVVVAFSSSARILGECSTIAFPACACFFLNNFFSED